MPLGDATEMVRSEAVVPFIAILIVCPQGSNAVNFSMSSALPAKMYNARWTAARVLILDKNVRRTRKTKFKVEAKLTYCILIPE